MVTTSKTITESVVRQTLTLVNSLSLKIKKNNDVINIFFYMIYAISL